MQMQKKVQKEESQNLPPSFCPQAKKLLKITVKVRMLQKPLTVLIAGKQRCWNASTSCGGCPVS